MTTYRALFAIGGFRALFAIRLLEMIGVVVSSLAVGTVVYDQTGSPLLTALGMFGGPVIQVVSSHFLLAASDLLRPRTALMVVGMIAAATDLLQLIPGMTWPFRFALVGVAYLAVSATGGSAIALLSDIVPADGFVLARSALNLTVGGMQVLGNAVGALLLLAIRPVDLFVVSGIATLAAAGLTRVALQDYPPRASGQVTGRTRRINKQLLGSAITRTIYLMMSIPNAFIVGCEALYIPYAHSHAGYLFAATSAGMLAGDIVIGRFTPAGLRDRLIIPLRVLLAAPLLLMFTHPPLAAAVVVLLFAGFGYVAALPLQDRLIHHVPPTTKGQAFALASTMNLVGQSIGAILAGVLADHLGPAFAMGLLAAVSLATTGLLHRGLRRSSLTSGHHQPV